MSDPNLAAVPTVLEARDRALYHWVSDGLPTLAFGLAVLVLGAGGLWSHRHTGFSEFLGDLVRLLAILFIGEEASLGKVAGWLKELVTYPRIGYVARPGPLTPDSGTAWLVPAGRERWRREKSLQRWIWGPMALFFLSMFLTGLSRLLAVACAVIASLWMALLVRRFGKTASALYVFFAMAIYGTLVALWPAASRGEAVAFSALITGVGIIFVGLIMFFLFLRKHPLPHA